MLVCIPRSDICPRFSSREADHLNPLSTKCGEVHVANSKGEIAGSPLSPLSAVGLREAEAVAAALRHIHIDQIVSSDRPRAAQTAEIVAGSNNLEVVTEPLLRERNWGVLGECEYSKYEALLSMSKTLFHEFVPEDGESYLDVEARIRQFCDKYLYGQHDASFLIVGHESVNKMLLKVLLKLSWNEFKSLSQPNACINTLEIRRGGLVNTFEIGCVNHLGRV